MMEVRSQMTEHLIGYAIEVAHTPDPVVRWTSLKKMYDIMSRDEFWNDDTYRPTLPGTGLTTEELKKLGYSSV